MPLTHSRAGGGGGGCYAVTWAKVKSFPVVLNEISATRSQLISMRSLYMVTEKKKKEKKTDTAEWEDSIEQSVAEDLISLTPSKISAVSL